MRKFLAKNWTAIMTALYGYLKKGGKAIKIGFKIRF